MHLKSCPKIARPGLDASRIQTAPQQSSLFVSQQGVLRRACSSNHGRLPLGVICTNTLRLTASSSPALQLVPPPSGCKNDALRIYQNAMDDADAPLDIWTVIKPGHVREKIAIFASEGGRRDGTEPNGSGPRDRTPAGLSRATKAKGSWEENCSAKRRRRSGNSQNLQQDQGVLDAQRHTLKLSPCPSDSARGPGGEAPQEDHNVSVVEMVAFLEQRASRGQPDCKPLLALQRSCATITLSRAPPPEPRGEEPESVSVLDMVAKLESECLRRRMEGSLSRSNSLRRTVGRVLLAVGDQNPAPSQLTSSVTSLSLSLSREPVRSSETDSPVSALDTPPSGELVGGTPDARGGDKTVTPPPPLEEEPLPGLLFLCPPVETLPFTEPRPPCCGTSPDPQPLPERRRSPALSRCASASRDFLETRQRVQQLLAPQPYLAVLPHHLLVKILLLLPTESLAALKCTCHYFKFVIENYSVRPADSLWVSDPRYRDDPCKQCKKRYGRGDVSLCRWHNKPYCQALPYGPGYWMCCHGARRDAPGCNVGLHDNRWVPPFHSINVPIYRRTRAAERR